MIFRVALKNHFKNKTNLFLISLIVLGCTSLIFFKSISSSILGNLDRIIYDGMLGMIWVTKPGFTSDHSFSIERFAVTDSPELQHKIRSAPHVIEVAPQILFSGNIKLATDSVQKSEGIILYGIDFKHSQRLFGQVQDWLTLESLLPKQETQANVQYTHKKFFEQGKNEQVVLLPNSGSKTKEAFPITITGYFKQHHPFGFSFVDLSYAQKMLGLQKNKILIYSVLLKDKSHIDETVVNLKKILGPNYEVQSTNQLQKGIIFYFKQLLQTLDLLYAALTFCFFSILYITIKSALHKRSKEIRIYAACGISKKRIAAYFTAEAIMVCLTAFTATGTLYTLIRFLFNLTGSTFRTGTTNTQYSLTTYLTTNYGNMLFVFTSTALVVTALMVFFSYHKAPFAKSL